jgi:hypothetical protein
LIDSADEWDIKRFKRWVNFWDSRIDVNGSYNSFIEAIADYTEDIFTSGKILQSLGLTYNDLRTNLQYVGRAQSVWVYCFLLKTGLFFNKPVLYVIINNYGIPYNLDCYLRLRHKKCFTYL